jgi:L-lactate dehydrogenase complex protein LldF
MFESATEAYKEEARRAIADQVLQNALADVQERLASVAAEAIQRLPEGSELRFKAHEIRAEAIANLDVLLERLTEKIQARGGQVHFAEDGREAIRCCLDIARRNQVKLIVKGKSMVTEEIGLNQALTAAGIEVAETDLGEYIIQLAGEHPSHIIAPAIHKTRDQVGKLFADKLGIEYSDDPPTLTRAARRALRAKFLSADMGITGCNLACAETGHITTLSNEGNIRMSTTLPRIHVALMGMERVVARLEDHDVLLRLLSRAAVGQSLANYISYVGGPRGGDQPDGPEQFHLIILDNGRSRILADEVFREMLYCIRCAACLNVCPVYGTIGGHSYGFPYSGPVGAVVTPLLVGINRAQDLCMGETLCGACQEACPVNIDIPGMLLELRAMLAEGDSRWGVEVANPGERALYTLWSWVIRNRYLYDLFLRAAALGQKLLPKRAGLIRWMPPPLNGWTAARDIKPLADESFISRWKRTHSKNHETR